MDLHPRIYARDFTPLKLSGAPFSVKSLSWRAMGGADGAELTQPLSITGNNQHRHTDQALAFLRRPVDVLQDGLHPVWNGYVHRAEIQQGSLCLSYDLSEVVNRVRAEYDPRIPRVEWQDAAALTDWQEDSESIRQYGIRERLLRLDSLTAADAERCLREYLSVHSQPRLQIETLTGEAAQPEMRLYCRGWYSTLDWQLTLPNPGMEGWVRPAPDTLTLSGVSGDIVKVAQSFVVTAGSFHAAEVGFNMRVTGFPTDSVRCDLCANNANLPGTVLASATVSAADLSGSRDWVRFTFPSPVALAEGSNAWLVLSRTGSADAANACQLYVDPGNPYKAGLALTHNGSTWVYPYAGRSDLNFFVNGVSTRASRLDQAVIRSPFLTGILFDASVGGYAALWADGRLTLREWVDQLLARTSADEPRLTARVDLQRRLVISPWPAQGQRNFTLNERGTLQTPAGLPLTPLDASAGVAGWYSVNAGQVLPLERVMWCAGSMRLG